MSTHHRIDYVEAPSRDLEATKRFFTDVFGFGFTDYGPDYTSFAEAAGGVNGGFFRSDAVACTERGSALIVFFSNRLEHTRDQVTQAGGTISKPIFSFPGGRRFHFQEPGGSEFAVWGE
jgi:predicted enzyme related to lactoylglutathione lyase